MDKTQAKDAADELARASAAFVLHLTRAKTIIDDPDKLNQGFYGVCAMTAAVRTLLLHDRARFIELLRAVFDPGNPGFRGLAADSAALLDHRLAQADAKKKRFLTAGRTYVELYDLDFILSRALGKLIKVADPAVYRNQCAFSERITKMFNVKGEWIELFRLPGTHTATLGAGVIDEALRRDLAYKSVPMLVACGFELDLATSKVTTVMAGSEWQISHPLPDGTPRTVSVVQDGSTPGEELLVRYRLGGPLRGDGDLGLDRDGLEFLMRQVVRASAVSSSIRESAVAVTEANTAFGAGAGSFVYAMINGSRRFMQAAGAARRNAPATDAAFDFSTPAPPGPDVWGRAHPVCTHVVDVTGPIREEGDVYVLPVWTWATRFEARIPRKLMGEYVYGYVYGRI
ncbi:hypothetical protein [Streptomyces sp. SID10815]|uniref:hypothetical protein n=1 Tax=Streptomyces sp. SID10815 TaxID=2706027 RepID=UPI0013C7C7CA|nr:hypothetical protein [Streptomyces sp. SID10815]NEA49712.1 hypothetical protein [Streptomyces sp. SID10815]